jgi:ferrous iron transport protein B
MAEMKTIAVVGNPNSGKTTLFNGLTGSTQRVGNWPGVTVEKKEGVIRSAGREVTIVDLPGIYSLTAQSEDERVSRDYILSGEPGLVVNILDGTNLERNLYLTTQLLEMGVPVLAIVNMMDLAETGGIRIDLPQLEKGLGCPVVGISATSKSDLNRAKEAIFAAWGKQVKPQMKTVFPAAVEAVLAEWEPKLAQLAEHIGATPRWIGLKLLESDRWVTDKVTAAGALTPEQIEAGIAGITREINEVASVILADARYQWIQKVTDRAVIRPKADQVSASDRIDRIVMHRILGIPIFLGVMYVIFWATMNIGGSFIDFFDILFGTVFVDGLGALLAAIHTPDWLVTVIAGGIGAGVQTLATFIPVIFMMFFMLSLLEDSGYMARAAFVMDRFMRWIGLPGKSFVPMLVGFGCSVPAIMATRTLENKRDRLLTIFMTPFMSCGARLPVYALFGAAFFGAGAGNMVFSLYLAGIVLAILTGLLMKKTLFKGEASHFVMELPPYHAPRFANIISYTWSRLRVFMFRTKVIIVVVAILAFLNSMGTDGSFGNEDSPNSVLAQIGKSITPVFEPMGVEKDNWPATVGIFTGIFAKEAVVGTLNSLYHQIDQANAGTDSAEAEAEGGFDFGVGVREAFASVPQALSGVWDSLRDPLGLGIVNSDQEAVAEEVGADQQVYGAMRRYFTRGPLQAYAYLLFILIYFPCVAALGAVLREMGQGYGWLAMGYLTVLAWIVATLFYQLTVGHQWIWIVTALALAGLIVIGFAWLGSRNGGAGGEMDRKNQALPG